MDRRAFLCSTGAMMGAVAAVKGYGATPAEIYGRMVTERFPSDAPPNGSPSHALAGMSIVVPSTLGVGESFDLRVRMLTPPYAVKLNCFTEYYPTVEASMNLSPRGIRYMDNTMPEWKGVVEVSADSGYAGPSEIVMDGGIGIYPHDSRPIRRIPGLHFTTPGIHRVTLRDPTSGITQTSNPVVVTAELPAQRLYWGDIHGHTSFTDGIRSPEEVYYFARDESFLDVCAITEHGEYYLTDLQWDYFQRVTNHFNQPNGFVTLVAHEWTSMTYGHRNMYYRSDTAPLVRATDPAWRELPQLYALAHQHGALVVPHHSASTLMGVDWTVDHDPEVERLAEIYSVWGSSERSAAAGNFRPIHAELGGETQGHHVVDALALGRRFGILASGDFHDGRPGNTLSTYQQEPAAYRYTQPGGLVGIWATGLTRDGIYDALWNRRVFGTTGPRMVLQFEIAGHPMGSTLENLATHPVRVRSHTDVPIDRIDLVRNGSDYEFVSAGACDVDWAIPNVPGDSWYYVRVTRQDGEMAWSSPIWIGV